MIRGLYTSAAGMLAESTRNDVTANNLANINTTGYKKDAAVLKSFPELLIQRINDQKKTDPQPKVKLGTLGTGAMVDEIITSHEQGAIKETSNPFDLAIEGEGYFTVQNQRGTFYTRNGAFTVDGQGFLVNSQGDYVLGQAGPVKIGNSSDVVIDGAGKVTVDGKQITTLRIVPIANKAALTKIGDSLFTGGQPGGTVGQVKQRFLEASNVNPITEMVNMITISRAYEANQKVITAHDQTLSLAMEVGLVK